MLGLDGGYSFARGHEYAGNLEPGVDALHGFLGYRFFGLAEVEGSFLNIQSPIKNSSETALTNVYSIDARFFPPLGGLVEPNLLLGYAPVADLHYATAFGNATEHGYSFNAGAGLRISLIRYVFLTADYRHMFIRHTGGDVGNGGLTFSGTFDHEQKGDMDVVLLGGGIQF